MAVETACSRCQGAVWTIEQGWKNREQIDSKQEIFCFCDRLKKVVWGAGADGKIVRFVVECSAMDSGAAPAVPDLVAAGTVVDGGMPAFRQ